MYPFCGTVPFYIREIQMTASITVSEDAPGSSNQTPPESAIYYWNERKARANEYSILAGQAADLDRSKRHCRNHPKDKQAAKRLARLSTELNANAITSAYMRYRSADTEYRQKMLEFAEIPLKYRPDARVDIFDDSGSVSIHFGDRNESRQYAGFWLLYANGKLSRLRSNFTES